MTSERRERITRATAARRAISKVGVCERCDADVACPENGTFRHLDRENPELAVALDADHGVFPICTDHIESHPRLEDDGRCGLCAREDRELEEAGL